MLTDDRGRFRALVLRNRDYSVWAGVGGPPCPADLDNDGFVGITDLLALLAAWGPCPDCNADLDGDDQVGITDLLALLAAWGPCP